MCNHNIVDIFPRLDDAATKEERTQLFLRMFREPIDLVICKKCRKIGHYIKSSRGGIRWHKSYPSKYIDEKILIAADCWSLVGKNVPYEQ
jgi:hypothetical protein